MVGALVRFRRPFRRDSTSSPGARHSWTRGLGLVLAGLLIWLSRMTLPVAAPDTELDASWRAALGHALERGMCFGTQVIFPMGPLGHLGAGSHVYDPDLFWMKVLAWEGAFRLLLTGILVWAATRIPGLPERAFFLVALVVLPLDYDQQALIAILAATALLLHGEGSLPRRLLPVGIALSALALVKFTFFVACAGCWLLAATALWQQTSAKRAGAVILAGAGCFLASWMACGQPLSGLLPWLRSTAMLASGYVEAQSTMEHGLMLPLALFLVGMLVVLVLLVAGARPRETSRLALGACLLFVTFVSFRTAFVRATAHAPFFFGFAPLAGLLLSTPAGTERGRRRAATALRLAIAASGIAGLCLSHHSGLRAPGVFCEGAVLRIRANVGRLASLREFREGCEADLRSMRARYSLPRTRSVVGHDPVDIISYRQGFLFLNGLRWHPRPTFQSYLTYTPELLSRNARFFEGADAPPFVLFRLETIDGRLPTMDDGLALRVLARDYRPVHEERGLLLLRRQPRAVQAGMTRVQVERTIAFGDRVGLGGLDGEAHLLALDIRYTWQGRLWLALFRSPPLLMDVEMEGGRRSTVRIAPGMVRTGVIVDPCMLEPEDWVAWLTGSLPPRLVAIVLRPPELPWMYEPSVSLTYSRADEFVPRR